MLPMKPFTSVAKVSGHASALLPPSRRRLTGGEERGKVLIIVNNAGERRRSARSEQKPMAARISSREFATMINGDDNC
jgi:hypothetical protein